MWHCVDLLTMDHASQNKEVRKFLQLPVFWAYSLPVLLCEITCIRVVFLLVLSTVDIHVETIQSQVKSIKVENNNCTCCCCHFSRKVHRLFQQFDGLHTNGSKIIVIQQHCPAGKQLIFKTQVE